MRISLKLKSVYLGCKIFVGEINISTAHPDARMLVGLKITIEQVAFIYVVFYR